MQLPCLPLVPICITIDLFVFKNHVHKFGDRWPVRWTTGKT